MQEAAQKPVLMGKQLQVVRQKASMEGTTYSDYAEEKLMPKLAQFSFSCKRIAVKTSA
jgi:hypothetical protein